MKALVTGGAGFIGSNICAALLREGVNVTILDNLSSGHAVNLEALSAAHFIRGDIRDPEAVARAMYGCEVVFHLAASVGNKRSINSPSDDTAINVNGTLTVLEAARAASVRKVVVSSSAGIYGELKAIPISEDHPMSPLTPYGVSKLYTERMSLAFAHVYGLESICLRYFNVYGPNQRFDAYGNVIPIFAFRALHGMPITIFGDGLQTRDFVHVDDVVQANLKAAICRGITGAFNIASGAQMQILKLAHTVIAHADGPVEIQYGPERSGDVVHSLADISAARAAFGFEPTVAMEAGLAQYMAWAKDEVSRQSA